MGNEYKVKVEAKNPEMLEDDTLIRGVEADGFVILCVKDGKPFLSCIHGVSIEQIARFLMREDDQNVCIIRQAMTVADGYRKAKEMQQEFEMEQRRKSMSGDIAEKLADLLKKRGGSAPD